ncbi:unc-69 [Pristionchus pacificus]|uniref:Transcription initiation factor TFIID subunit 12 n=1 Tax=Pristionchus pacificus TaxID=54126 RepID=A0A2A6B9Y4_PRIPA|nr:unc-69 [Pristionchus pacificus]|eukprot:PDM62690.1 unc-69 [Pristionchus pacificus]
MGDDRQELVVLDRAGAIVDGNVVEENDEHENANADDVGSNTQLDVNMSAGNESAKTPVSVGDEFPLADEGEDTIKVVGRTPRPAQPLPREEPPEDAEEKARLIAHVLELQDTLDDLSQRVECVKEESVKLRSENQVLGQYIQNLMASSSVFQSSTPAPNGISPIQTVHCVRRLVRLVSFRLQISSHPFKRFFLLFSVAIHPSLPYNFRARMNNQPPPAGGFQPSGSQGFNPQQFHGSPQFQPGQVKMEYSPPQHPQSQMPESPYGPSHGGPHMGGPGGGPSPHMGGPSPHMGGPSGGPSPHMGGPSGGPSPHMGGPSPHGPHGSLPGPIRVGVLGPPPPIGRPGPYPPPMSGRPPPHIIQQQMMQNRPPGMGPPPGPPSSSSGPHPPPPPPPGMGGPSPGGPPMDRPGPPPQSHPSSHQPPPPPGVNQPVLVTMNANQNEGVLIEKNKLEDLAKEVEPSIVLEEPVKDALLEYTEEFVDELVDRVCRLATHRNNNRLEARDVELVLEQVFNMPRVPRASTFMANTTGSCNQNEKNPGVVAHNARWDERDILCLFNPSRDLFSLHMRLPFVFLIFLHSTTQWSFIGQTIFSYVENLERNDPFLLPIDFPLNWSLNFLKIPILELYQAKIVSAQLLSPTEGFLLDFQNDTVSITIRDSTMNIEGTLDYMLLGQRPTIPLHVTISNLFLSIVMPSTTNCSIQIPTLDITIGFKILGGLISRLAKEPLRKFLIHKLCPEIGEGLEFPVELIFSQYGSDLNGRNATSLFELRNLLRELDDNI